MLQQFFALIAGPNTSPADRAATWQALYAVQGANPTAFMRMIQEFDTVEARLANEFSQEMGLSRDQLRETMRQFDLTTAEGQRQFNDRLGHDRAVLETNRQLRTRELDDGMTRFGRELDQRESEYARTHDLDVDRFRQARQEFDRTIGQRENEFARTHNLDADRFRQAQAEFNQEFTQRGTELARRYGLDVDRFHQAQTEFSRRIGLDETELARRYGLDVDRFRQATTEFNQDLDLRRTELGRRYGLDVDRFRQAQQEFNQDFAARQTELARRYGLDVDRFRQAQDEFDHTFTQRTQEFAQTHQLDSARLAESIRGTNLADRRERDLATQRIVSDERQAQLQRDEIRFLRGRYDLTRDDHRQQFADRLGLDRRELDDAMGRFNLQQAEGARQFDATLGLRQAEHQLNVSRLAHDAATVNLTDRRERDLFAQRHGLDVRQVDLAFQQFGHNQQAFAQSLQLDRDRFGLDERRAGAAIAQENRRVALDEEIRRRGMVVEEARAQIQNSIEQGRFGLETQRFGLETGRFGLETELGRRGMALRELMEPAQLGLEAARARGQQNLAEAQTLLNAPRGAADIWSYAARLPGLALSGNLGGTLGRAITGATGTPLSALGQGPVLTNSQLASDLVAAAAGRPVGDLTATFLRRTMGVNVPTAAPGVPAPPGSVTPTTGAPATPQVPPGGFGSSIQEWQRLEPSLRRMYGGLIEELGGETPEDFLYNLTRGAPTFGRSPTARLG